MSKTPETTPSPPPPPEPRHVAAMSTNIEVMACTLGFFFLCAILCAAFRLLYLKRLEHRRRNRLNRPVRFGPAEENPVWLVNFVGLSQSAIDTIAMFKYKEGEGLVEGTECSVCLGEFEEDEDVRSLPKCGHAFHAPCIDTWLRSHKNCPLCRAPVVAVGSVGDAAARVETLVEGSEGEVESETEVEDRVGEGSGTVTLTEGEIGENSKMCDSREIRNLVSEREVDCSIRCGEGGSGNEIDMGFGDVTMMIEGEIGGNSKSCDSREIGGLLSEREVNCSIRRGESGYGVEIDMGFGDVTLIESETGKNSKNCDSQEIGGFGDGSEFDSRNHGCGYRSGTEVDMGFGNVMLIECESGGNSKNCDSREIRGLATKRELHRQGGSDAIMDIGFGDLTRIDDQIGRNWKFCDFRAKIDLDHQNLVRKNIHDVVIEMDDVIGRNSKNLDSRAFSDLADRRIDLERRNSKKLVSIEPVKRSVSIGSNSSELGESKRNSLKNNGDGNRNSSLFRLIRSASSGRLSNRSSMKRSNSGSSGNSRSHDSILPL